MNAKLQVTIKGPITFGSIFFFVLRSVMQNRNKFLSEIKNLTVLFFWDFQE